MFIADQDARQVGRHTLNKRLRPGEFIIQGFLFFCGAFSILITLGIVYEVGKEALLFFASPEVNLWRFFTGVKWQPQAAEFGILPLVSATLMTTLARACPVPR